MDSRAKASGSPFTTNLALHLELTFTCDARVPQLDAIAHAAVHRLPYRIIGFMARMDLYIKVKVEIDNGEEDPKKLAAEICRLIQKVYGVRSAELSSFVISE